ncbi:unnamed protein product [Owenia fusiformis]|uniref:Uncharacterized protein n=1 Tax=Owenia fusiformis TaxID=6347 RepID=A0A8J1V0A1_OWEFU|nr:unnamed protein product [Owenia fusiformis]
MSRFFSLVALCLSFNFIDGQDPPDFMVTTSCHAEGPALVACQEKYFGDLIGDNGPNSYVCGYDSDIDPTGNNPPVCDIDECTCVNGLLAATSSLDSRYAEVFGVDISGMEAQAYMDLDQILDDLNDLYGVELSDENRLYLAANNEELNGTPRCTYLKNVSTSVSTMKTQIDDYISNNPSVSITILGALQRMSNYFNWVLTIYLPNFATREGFTCISDDQCLGTRHRRLCGSDCQCSLQCRVNNDCSDPSRPNCRSNRAGIMVCGDPHISQTIKGSSHKLCYDFFGESGATYLVFRDHNLDVMATFITSTKTKYGIVEYVGALEVRTKDFRMSVTPLMITLHSPGKDTQIYKWMQQTLNIEIGWASVSKKQVRIFIDGEMEILIIRKGNAKGEQFLNFGVTEIDGVSKSAGGILGSIGQSAIFDAQTSHEGVLYWANVTFPVKIAHHQCLKISENFQDKFNDILQMFKVSNERPIGHIIQ